MTSKQKNTLKTHYDQLYIAGNWQAPSAGFEDVISPATEAVVGQAPVGNIVDLDMALAAARQAFDSGVWSDASRDHRACTSKFLHENFL